MQTLKYIGWAIWIAAGLLTLWNSATPRLAQVGTASIFRDFVKTTNPVVAKPCPEPPQPDYFVINGKVIPNPVKTRMGPPLTPEKREEQARKVLE